MVRRRGERGDGEGLPSPDSESAFGTVIPSRGVECKGIYDPGTLGRFDNVSESRRLGQSRSESLGAILLL